MKTQLFALLAILLVSCENQNGKLITPPDQEETKEENIQPKFTTIDTVISGYCPLITDMEVPVTMVDLEYTITQNGKTFEQSPACYIDVLRGQGHHYINLNGDGINTSPRVIEILSKEYLITITQRVITPEQIEAYNPSISPDAQALTLSDAGFYGMHYPDTELYREFGYPVTNRIQDNGTTTTQVGYWSKLTKHKNGSSATDITLEVEANTTSKERTISIFNTSSYNRYTIITQQGIK